MVSFGRTPPRSLASFGVSGLLAEGCTVLYENLFDTQAIGRVSDLFWARLKNEGFDELRVRALLLFSAFEAYRNPGHADRSNPAVMECGIDGEKIAIGLSFIDKALASRITKGEEDVVFENLLAHAYSQADRVVLRADEQSGKVEVVSLLGLAGKIEAKYTAEKPPIERIMLVKTAESTPKAREYTQLADLDYTELLSQETPAGKVVPPTTGDILVRASSPEKEFLARVRDHSARAGDEKTMVHGRAERDDTVSHVLGTAVVSEAENQLVQGSGFDANDETVTVHGAVNPTTGPSLLKIASSEPHVEEVVRNYENRIGELQAQIERLRAEKKEKSFLPGFLKRAWHLGRVEGSSEKESGPQSNANGSEPSAVAPPTAQDQNNEATEDSTQDVSGEFTTESLSRTLSRAVIEAKEIKKEIESERAQRWVDGLMGELVGEKARLSEVAKKLNVSTRQKEYEFKTREATLQEELRRRDDTIRHKDSLLVRLKEQLSEVTMTLERTRANLKAGTEGSRYKQRYDLAQKMLAAAKQENSSLSAKVEELRTQLASAQGSSKKGAVSSAELATLRAKYEHVNRQCEEFRKSNNQLAEKLAQAKRERNTAGGNIEEMKKRLESAVQLATTRQREMEQLQLKLEELQREDARLRMELSRHQASHQKQQAEKGAAGAASAPAAKKRVA